MDLIINSFSWTVLQQSKVLMKENKHNGQRMQQWLHPHTAKCGFSLYYPALTQWPEYKDSNITQYSDLIEYSSIKFWDKVTKHKNIWQFCIIGNAKVIQLSSL